MKILAINLSNNPNSINRVLLENVSTHIGAEVIPFEELDFPLFQVGLPEPKTLATICEKIKSADKIIFASPEYNATVSPYGKNVIDWISTKGVFGGVVKETALSGKPVFIMSASPGAMGGIRVLPCLSQIIAELGGVVVRSVCTAGGYKPDTYDHKNIFTLADSFKDF